LGRTGWPFSKWKTKRQHKFEASEAWYHLKKTSRHLKITKLIEVGYVVTPGGEMVVLPANSTFLQGLEHHGDETLHICDFYWEEKEEGRQ